MSAKLSSSPICKILHTDYQRFFFYLFIFTKTKFVTFCRLVVFTDKRVYFSYPKVPYQILKKPHKHGNNLNLCYILHVSFIWALSYRWKVWPRYWYAIAARYLHHRDDFIHRNIYCTLFLMADILLLLLSKETLLFSLNWVLYLL